MSVPIIINTSSASAISSWLSFHYADELIHVERAQRAREASRILIKVGPDCRVRVSAPDGASDEQVLAALKQRGRWIYQQLREFRAQLTHVRPRQYISGESHYYLGKQYVLKVIEAPDELQQVRLQLPALEHRVL